MNVLGIEQWIEGYGADLFAVVTRGPGNYVNLLKLAPVIIVYLLWVYTTHWVQKDVKQLALRTEVWQPAVFFPEIIGFGLFWIISIYPFQLLLLVLFWAVPLGFYIHERNQRVSERQMVTAESVCNAMLAKIGIYRAAGIDQEETEGPPIQLIGKDVGAASDAQDRAGAVAEAEAMIPTKELIYDAMVRRATELVIEPKKGQLGVRYRIDGIMRAAENFERPTGEQVIQILKILGGMNPKEKRKPQTGSFLAKIGNREVQLRVDCQGTMAGEKFSIRLLDSSSTVANLSGLGMRDKTAEQLRELIAKPEGLILLAGPPDIGKTTSLYAMLREIDRFTRNVMTIEDRIDFQVDNVTQIDSTKDPENRPLPVQLRSLFRQLPDVAMVSSMTDQEIAEMLLREAEDRLLLTSINAPDAMSGLFRLLKLGVDRALVAKVLTAVWSQRLVRRLCEHCKEPYKPKAEFLKKANLPASRIDVFYRPPRNSKEVCPNCGGTGYMERTGIFELLIVNERIRELLKAGSPVNAVKAEARKNGMVYLQEDGLRQVIRGVTSVDELMRTLK